MYIWHWDHKQQQQQCKDVPKRRSSSGRTAAAAGPYLSQQIQQQQQCQDVPGRRSSSGAAEAAALPLPGLHLGQQAPQQQGRLTRRRSQAQAEQALMHQSDQQQQQQQAPNAASGSAVDPNSGVIVGPQPHEAQQQEAGLLSSTDWPMPTELQKLNGHKNEVLQTEFSHGGTKLATASSDGSVRVRYKDSGTTLMTHFIHTLCLCCVQNSCNTCSCAGNEDIRSTNGPFLIVLSIHIPCYG